LLVGEAVGGVADAVSLLGQVGQETGALVDDGGYESRHGRFSISAGRAGGWVSVTLLFAVCAS
jgi:hypothetical protein